VEKAQPNSSGRVWLRYLLALAGLSLVLVIAARSVDLTQLWQLVQQAHPGWLVAALLFKLATPMGTAMLYAHILSLLGSRTRAWRLWLTAQVAIFANMAFPAGPVAMSAILLQAFRRRKIPEGVTTLAVTLDTLSYQAAFVGLISFGVIYLLGSGQLGPNQLSEAGVIALVIVLGVGYLWFLQRDRAKLTSKLVAIQQWIAKLLKRDWQPSKVEGFLDEIYRGKDVLAKRPFAFVRLFFFQVLVLFLDLMTIYCCFLALGDRPHLSVVTLSYALANFLSMMALLPGGGGSFEATMVLTSSQLGVNANTALGATLIYRVLTFWLPALLTALTYRRVLGKQAETPKTELSNPNG
jgi:uncharacterized protein (TIRG00374 family)